MEVIDLFYTLAKEHKRINGFIYGKAYEKGAGNDKYPLVWLDDPLSGNSAGAVPVQKVLNWSCNVDILGIPDDLVRVEQIQAMAFLVGLGMVERIEAKQATYKYTVESFGYISLRDYYDDNAAGYRFTYLLTAANPVNRCADDWDPDKVLTNPSPLAVFSADGANACAVFTDKKGLPNFSVAP